jgi:hypothetical protein
VHFLRKLKKHVFWGYPPLTFHQPKIFCGAPPKNFWVDESKRSAALWVDADSKKSQIQMVPNGKKTLSIIYSTSITSRNNFSGSGGTSKNLALLNTKICHKSTKKKSHRVKSSISHITSLGI